MTIEGVFLGICVALVLLRILLSVVDVQKWFFPKLECRLEPIEREMDRIDADILKALLYRRVPAGQLEKYPLN